MHYEGIVYRPPSEAGSLIVQATIGCSHNKCAFCNMYADKVFRIRPTDEIIDDIRSAKRQLDYIRRVFLADGDALIIKTDELLRILLAIKEYIPECERVGIYASPKSVYIKSSDELKKLNEAGLGIAYMGLESGSDTVLKNINKGFTSEEIVEAGIKLKEAGIKLSVTLISGLGGIEYWQEHAVNSANAINEMKPDYLGLLTLMVYSNTRLYKDIQNGSFTLLSPEQVAVETLTMLEHLDAEGCIFRSNHASNYLVLKGTLNKDREKLIEQLKAAISGHGYFKKEVYRGL